MPAATGGPRRRRRTRRPPNLRYTIDASVFVNAFNSHKNGHAACLQLLTAIQERGDPVMVPVLLIPEIAAKPDGPTATGVGQGFFGRPTGHDRRAARPLFAIARHQGRSVSMGDREVNGVCRA